MGGGACRLVSVVLETCGQYFSKGPVAARLDGFLLYLGRYLRAKPEAPLDVVLDLQAPPAPTEGPGDCRLCAASGSLALARFARLQLGVGLVPSCAAEAAARHPIQLRLVSFLGCVQELVEGLRPGLQLPATYQDAVEAVANYEAKQVPPRHTLHSRKAQLAGKAMPAIPYAVTAPGRKQPA